MKLGNTHYVATIWESIHTDSLSTAVYKLSDA